jgi:hypothetical protein
MMANDFKAMVEIQSMRIVPLWAAIQMDLVALGFFSLLDYPL